jgi:hypothetical protein
MYKLSYYRFGDMKVKQFNSKKLVKCFPHLAVKCYSWISATLLDLTEHVMQLLDSAQLT